MEYTIEIKGTECRVNVLADLTASVAANLQADLKQKLQQNIIELVFDIKQSKMMDSTGIGLLIAASNTVGRKQGKIRVINTSSEMFQLLQSMRLVTRLNVSAPNDGE